MLTDEVEKTNTPAALLVPAVGEPDGHGNIADKFSFPEHKVFGGRNGRQFKCVLELHLDPGPGFLDRTVENFVKGIAFGETLLQVREISLISAVFVLTKNCRVNKLHVDSPFRSTLCDGQRGVRIQNLLYIDFEIDDFSSVIGAVCGAPAQTTV